jgi:hypothetical protein
MITPTSGYRIDGAAIMRAPDRQKIAIATAHRDSEDLDISQAARDEALRELWRELQPFIIRRISQ